MAGDLKYMSPRDDIQTFLRRLFRLAIISSPLLIFLIFLSARGKINGQELSIFIALLVLMLVYILFYFNKKLEALDRKTTLQIHDNKQTRENQLLLMSIMENLSDPLLLLDASNRILMANKSANTLLGDQILRQDISLFIRNSNLYEALGKTLETGEPASCEFQHGAPVARHFLARIHLFGPPSDDTPTSESSGNSAILHPHHAHRKYILIAIYDISLLKHVDKMRMDFVANASHELRTPLASILGFVETLQGPAKGDMQAHERFLNIMHDEASRMSRLIEDLLSLSRIERDEHIKPSDTVDLAGLIRSVIAALGNQARDKNMAISFSHGQIGDVTGDHDQLTQVFQNLIENAIKYGRKNSEIKVECSDLLSPGSAGAESVTITVTNEGPGIPAEHLPRLMERFYRVDSARSRNLGGTGLGLAIVKHIIQRHHGRIFFESEINADTRVTISLPK